MSFNCSYFKMLSVEVFRSVPCSIGAGGLWPGGDYSWAGGYRGAAGYTFATSDRDDDRFSGGRGNGGDEAGGYGHRYAHA